MDYKKLYIGGAWTKSETNRFIDVLNPYTNELIAQVPDATEAEVLMAIAAANDAKEAWAQTAFSERVEILRRALEHFKSASEKVADVIVDELGSPIKWSQRVQVGSVIEDFEDFFETAKDFAFEETYDSYTLYKEPVGVVAAICPWNYPVSQVAAKVIPALLTGNAVIVKPSSETPLSAYYFIDAFHKAGIPKGVINYITGSGSRVGALLAGSTDVDMVSFTGSTEVGREIAKLAGQNINKVVLELGGKSPCLVLEGADLDVAAKVVMNSCFLNTGQTCTARTRLFVPQDLRAALIEKIRANIDEYKGTNPRGQNVKVGTLVSKRQKQIVLQYAKSALEDGAILEIGEISESADCLFDPIVFTNVRNDMKIAQEEIFGPILAVIEYCDLDEAIRQCNDTTYGLAASVIGPEDAAVQAAKKIKAGSIRINDNSAGGSAPFGGYKNSGIGRESGIYGFNEFVEIKVIAKDNTAKSH